ncbi:MAG: ATP-binding cassette domain-containing protein [Actinomycetes bacterium]
MALLEVEDLTVRYGAVTAVREVSLAVEEGATLAVLGANGAGKTSLLRALTGLEPVAGGRVRFDGTDVTGWAPHRIARRRVAHVPDDRGILPTMTVAENLRMGLVGAGRDGTPEGRGALAEVRELFPILAERAEQTAGDLSGGQQQMLTIARALVQDPRLLLLDEMSMGLAPSIVADLFDVVRDLQGRGITIVLVEQFVGQALSVADGVMVLEQGRVIAAGTPDELAGDDLAAAYLGADDDAAIGPVPPPPARVTAPVTAALPPRQVRALERTARARGTSVDALVAEAVTDLLAADRSDTA